MEWPPVEREDPSGPATRRVSHIAPHNATWTMAAAEGAWRLRRGRRQRPGRGIPHGGAPARTPQSGAMAGQQVE
jgi:hypothetical protein